MKIYHFSAMISINQSINNCGETKFCSGILGSSLDLSKPESYKLFHNEIKNDAIENLSIDLTKNAIDIVILSLSVIDEKPNE